MARQSDNSNNEWSVEKGEARATRESKRVKEMKRVGGARLPKVGNSYKIDGFVGLVKVLSAKPGGVEISYLQGGRTKKTTVSPLKFDL